MILYYVIRFCWETPISNKIRQKAIEKIDTLLTSTALKKSIRMFLILKLVEMIIQLEPQMIKSYDKFLIECLDSEDDSLRIPSLSILFKSQSDSIDIITDKAIEILKKTNEERFKRQIANQYYFLIESKALNFNWFFDKSITLLKNYNDLLDIKILNKLV